MDTCFTDTVLAAGHWIGAHPYAALIGALVLVVSSRVFFGRSSYVALLQDLRNGVKVTEYDVVIIGGGTAGCVLAGRLSENPAITVCLLETGESSLSLSLSRMPSAYSQLYGSEYIYNLETTGQAYAADRERYWPRGKMLGGCSSVNAQIFHTASPSDFDEWARTGLDGADKWSYVNLRKYFLRFEKFSRSTANPGVNSDLHGSGGPVQTGFFGYFSKIGAIFIEACYNAGIPFQPDFNTPEGTMGVGRFMTYIDAKGTRVSTQSAYLTPEVLKRKNLSVLTHASVTKIILESTSGSTCAKAVEVSPDQGTLKLQIKARKEVILCAGAIHTPQILMLSGIGPADQLKAHDIPVVVDLPGVGAHLMDHATVDVALQETNGHSLFFFQQKTWLQTVKFAAALVQYLLTGKGPFSTNWMEAGAFVRSSDPTLFPPEAFPVQVEDRTSGANAPDLELTITPTGYLEHGRVVLPDALGLHIVLLRSVLLCAFQPAVSLGNFGSPKSLGSVKLRSANPFDSPLLDPNYLSSANDLNILLRGMKLLNRVAGTSPLADIIGDQAARDPKFGPLNWATASDDTLASYIRENLESLYHPTSTARMALLEAGGVVDAELLVHGVKNLRVVDASIFPTIPSGHTSAPTIAVAEIAAEMIQDAHS
ncbi:GMC oxidoreductase [Mycena vitilis]|nr:GMC oxidoreductase [Mycena vitilis]